jgi:hypothetical protein
VTDQKLYPLTSVTEDGVYGPFLLSGNHIVCVIGDLGGATIRFFHRMPETMGSTTMVELPQDPEMEFTALPAPFPYKTSSGLPLYIELITTGVATDITVGMFKVGD